MPDRHPSTLAAMRFFSTSHLTDNRLRALSRKFSVLANELLQDLPDDPELTTALQKLRESKDRAVALAAITAPPA